MNYYLKDLYELCGSNTPITKVFFRAGQKVEETALMLKAILGLRLDTGRLLPFLQAFTDQVQ